MEGGYCANKIIVTVWCLLLASPLGLRAEEQTDTARDKLSALDRRIQIERETRYQPFVITPHKPNYILPISYNSTPNNAPIDVAQEGELDNYEVKFQFSMKFSIAENLFGENGSLQFAYTNLSFWQAYNESASSPFRETVHEPELFLILPNEWTFLGAKNRLIQVGVVHQSNGRSGAQSRSWNRVYADFIFQYGDFYLSLKPWYRFGAIGVDDNPDIETYLGHGELRLAYAKGEQTVSLMLRNNLQSPNYGALELNWSFPMSRRVKWFLQYFNGYGESLIDYNARTHRVGIGVAFTDWL
jgi:phospholipase A1